MLKDLIKQMISERRGSCDPGRNLQDIGFWLAPYTNNIRICFRIDEEKANMNENQDEKIINKIQYVDVLNVPIRFHQMLHTTYYLAFLVV